MDQRVRLEGLFNLDHKAGEPYWCFTRPRCIDCHEPIPHARPQPSATSALSSDTVTRESAPDDAAVAGRNLLADQRGAPYPAIPRRRTAT